MRILYIDTSSSYLYSGIVTDKKLVCEVKKEFGHSLSEEALPSIVSLFEKENLTAKDIDKIIVVNGPGSFTGIRIGVTIAKTYGYLVNNSLYPMSSLKELALSTKEKKEYIMSLISAKNNNYYIGLYAENYEEVVNEQFMNETNIIELIKEYNPTLVGDNIYTLGEYYTSKVDLDILSIINYYKNKRKVMSHELLPNYLKQPQALENKND